MKKKCLRNVSCESVEGKCIGSKDGNGMLFWYIMVISDINPPLVSLISYNYQTLTNDRYCSTFIFPNLPCVKPIEFSLWGTQHWLNIIVLHWYGMMLVLMQYCLIDTCIMMHNESAILHVFVFFAIGLLESLKCWEKRNILYFDHFQFPLLLWKIFETFQKCMTQWWRM
jgi:hypothetical protein